MAGAAQVQRRTAHPYYMHDAIREQPAHITRLLEAQSSLIERAADAAASRRRIVFAGTGTSYHAAQLGEHFLRHLTGGRAHAVVELSFELVHYPLALGSDDGFVVISHRGRKNYSVQALKAAKAAAALTIAVTGQDAGEGMLAADFILPTCEQEFSFAHTKSYTTALAVLAAFAVRVAERRGQASDAASARLALARVPDLMQHALACEAEIREAARQISSRHRWVFVGAGPNWATAREAALKVKETCYIAAEGFETEQFLHGPLAEMDSRAALVALLTSGPGDERMRSLLAAVGELGVLRIAIAAEGGAGVLAEHSSSALAGHSSTALAEHVIHVPAAEEWLTPFVLAVPIQLLAYHAARELGANPDTSREDQPAHARAKDHYKL